MLLLLTSRAYPDVNNVKRFTDAGSASRMQAADLAARSVNRNKDLTATTDAHHRAVRVYAQRPGKGLQAKQSESRPYKSRIETEITHLTVYTIIPMY